MKILKIVEELDLLAQSFEELGQLHIAALIDRATSQLQKQAVEKAFRKEDVEALRKDFLMLMKNVDRIVEYEDFTKFREAVKQWRAYYENAVYQEFLSELSAAIWLYLTGENRYNEQFDAEHKKWYEYWNKKIRSGTWDLYIQLSNIPKSLDDQTAFNMWTSIKKEWADKVKREARKAWGVLGEFLEWMAGRNQTPIKNVQEKHVEVTEGFNVTYVGFEPTKEHNVKSMTEFQAGLKHYRERASQVFPLLLKAKLPIICDFQCKRSVGGSYERDHILFCAGSFAGPQGVAHVMAHEMGHHIYKSVLSGHQQNYWTHAIHQDWGPLDLNHLLKEWKPGEKIWTLEERLADKDPILSLQIACLTHESLPEHMNWDDREDVEAYIAEHGPIITVPKHPITGYGHKNPEESFCETLGLLVSYGPRALDPLVRSWLHTILPEVRVAQAESNL